MKEFKTEEDVIKHVEAQLRYLNEHLINLNMHGSLIIKKSNGKLTYVNLVGELTK